MSRTLLALLLTVVGCARDDAQSAGRDEAPSAETSAAECSAEAKALPEPEPPAWSAGLEAALARSVVPPESDDATYRVDPFVAALVFEEFAANGGKGLVEPWASDGAAGSPSAGYRVLPSGQAPLVSALGLAEGDIVEALNGVVLTGPQRVGFALDGAENRVTLMVYRDGYSFTLSYRLADGLAWRNVLLGYAGAPDPAAADGGDSPGGEAQVSATPNAGADTEPSTAAAKKTSGSRAPKVRPSSPRPGAAKPSTKSPSSSGGAIRCKSSTQCTIEKATYLDMVASPKKLQSQVKVVPAIKNNVHSGYKIKSIRAGSPAAKLGFRAGDKITHINGRDLTNEMQALQLYWSLGSARLFKVRFERGSSRRVKTISIQ